MGTSRATHPITCASVPTWAHAVPRCLETRGTTYRTTAYAWAHACLGWAWPLMGPWPYGMLPVGACFHGRMWPCTHGMAWQGMYIHTIYGSCGSIRAWSDTGPATAVVCRCLEAEEQTCACFVKYRMRLMLMILHADFKRQLLAPKCCSLAYIC